MRSPTRPDPRPRRRHADPSASSVPPLLANGVVRVNNPRGLHARAGVYLSRLIARYEVEVTLSTRGLEADARKAAAILLLGAGPGDAIAVTCRGRQASEAWAALEHYFASDFLAAEKDEP